MNAHDPVKGLPVIFTQRTTKNERMASLLSSVFFRSIKPDFTSSIRRHPLSLWTLYNGNDSAFAGQKRPVLVLLQSRASDESMKVLAEVLKKEFSASGFLVAEVSSKESSHGTTDEIFSSFDKDSKVFVIDLHSGINFLQGHAAEKCVAGVISFHPTSNAVVNRLSFVTTPQLILLPKQAAGSTTATTYTARISSYMNNPDATVLCLPEKNYGDDGANSLWVARTALKWTKAVQLVENKTKSSTLLIRSRL